MLRLGAVDVDGVIVGDRDHERGVVVVVVLALVVVVLALALLALALSLLALALLAFALATVTVGVGIRFPAGGCGDGLEVAEDGIVLWYAGRVCVRGCNGVVLGKA